MSARTRPIARVTFEGAPAEKLGGGGERVASLLDAAAVLGLLAEALGAETHDVFVLHHESGLCQEEVARIVGRDPKTVRKRLRAARAFLRRTVG